MSTIRFDYINDIPGGTDVTVQFDDNENPFIEDLLSAFEQFLLGMTYQPGTINKYLATEKVQDALIKRAQLVYEMRQKIATAEKAKAKTKKSK